MGRYVRWVTDCWGNLEGVFRFSKSGVDASVYPGTAEKVKRKP
jgi:hypothetical protein